MASTPIFISMTTMSSRIKTIPTVLEGLLNQTLPPDRIILNISSEPFMLDQGISFSDLPLSVRELVAEGKIELYRVPNVGPYRKLLPTLRRFGHREFLLATADDDVIYPPGWLAGLYDAYTLHRCIAAYRCRLLTFGAAGLTPYTQWPIIGWMPSQDSSLDLVPTGRSGVLYSSSFFPSITFLDELRRLAPGQDDLAFRIATLLQKIPVAIASSVAAGSGTDEFLGLHNSETLFSTNQKLSEGLSVNDRIWSRLVEYCLARDAGVDILSRLRITCKQN